MPIRRPRSPKPTLRHLAFLDALSTRAAQDADVPMLKATLLTLRLLDEWQRSGAALVHPDSQALRATREALQAIAADAELFTALGRLLDAMVMLQEPDVYPLATRLPAIAAVFDARGLPELASDIRQSLGAPDIAPRPRRKSTSLEPA